MTTLRHMFLGCDVQYTELRPRINILVIWYIYFSLFDNSSLHNVYQVAYYVFFLPILVFVSGFAFRNLIHLELMLCKMIDMDHSCTCYHSELPALFSKLFLSSMFLAFCQMIGGWSVCVHVEPFYFVSFFYRSILWQFHIVFIMMGL